MTIASDGFMDLTDRNRVRTPGRHEDTLEPLPEGEALAFLFSHSFPGARRVVRSPSEGERSVLRRAMWSDSINERMDLVDRVWRAITEPADVRDREAEEPILVQVVLYGRSRVYPLYLVKGRSRVIRPAENGGSPLKNGAPRIDLQEENPAA